MKSVLAVALGGAAGSALRYAMSTALARAGAGAFPWTTFTVNVTGALLLGFLARYFAPGQLATPLALLLTAGLCGGFTTFSTFTLDLFTLLERGQVGRAALYAIASVALSYAAFAAGHLAARALKSSL